MAHRVTAPAMQRAQRLLDQRITPQIFGEGVNFDVGATEEFFTSPNHHEAITSPVKKFALGTKWGRPWHTRWFHLTATVPAELAGKPLVAHLDVGFIGGGDGFAAGLIYGMLAGKEPEQALRLGWAHGALLTTFPGDTTMAKLPEVETLAKGGSARVQR